MVASANVFLFDVGFCVGGMLFTNVIEYTVCCYNYNLQLAEVFNP